MKPLFSIIIRNVILRCYYSLQYCMTRFLFTLTLFIVLYLCIYWITSHELYMYEVIYEIHVFLCICTCVFETPAGKKNLETFACNVSLSPQDRYFLDMLISQGKSCIKLIGNFVFPYQPLIDMQY